MFGEWLRTAREERRLSQAALARAIGVTSQAINQLERGKREIPSPEILYGVARVFGISLEDVYRHAGLAAPPINPNNDSRLQALSPEMLADLRERYPDLSDADLELAIDLGTDSVRRIKERNERQA